MVKLKELAESLGLELYGNPDYEITGVQSLEQASSHDLSFITDSKKVESLVNSQAGALIVPPELAEKVPEKNLLLSENPSIAFIKAVEYIAKPYDYPVTGVSEKAFIEEGVIIEENVSIYPGAYIGRNSKIRRGVRIYPGVYVGENCEIGEDSILFPHVTLYRNTILGKRVILHSGAVIGADGFGYVFHQGVHYKFPQVGRVVIEDDVEIGANSCIDRATLGETRIGKGTKIDNLVQVGHNVQVGQGSILVAQVGIAGSSKIGNFVVLGGKAAVRDHIELGDGCQVAATAAISKSYPPGTKLLGIPAYPADEGLKILAATKMLPKMRKKLQELEKRLNQLEEKE